MKNKSHPAMMRVKEAFEQERKRLRMNVDTAVSESPGDCLN
jgi:hypothetical protein